MHRRMAALLLAVIAVAIPGPVCAAAYYVSPSGSDTNSGSITSPFKTIQHAVSVMSTSSIKTTYVRAGEYFFNGSSLSLTSADSGIQLLGYPGEAPILSGGFQVTTWTSQSSPAGSWSAPLPSGFSTSSPTDMPPVVSVNGQWYDVARTPDVASGSNRYNSPSDYFMVASDTDASHFYFAGTNINSSNYNSEPTAGVGVWSYNGWGFDPLPISSVNFSTKEITTVNGSQFGIANNSRYFLYGTKGSLTTAGEFFEDTANSKLWIIPPSGNNPNNDTVVISESEGPAVVEINGANDVTISGFQIRDQDNSDRWDNAVGNYAPQNGGVRIDSGDSDIVMNNSISCTGTGVDTESGATNCLIYGNEIFDTVCGAIDLGGTNTSANNQAIANYIHDTGLFEQGARAVGSVPAPNNVAYNLIVNVPHDAIIYGDGATDSNGLTIQYNNIQHASQGADDTSAIYLKNGGNYNASAPDVVRYNFVTDSGGTAYNSSGTLFYPDFSFGVYMDATTNQHGVWMGSSGTQIYGNVFNQDSQGGFFAHDGENNNIYDNIVANSPNYQLIMESENEPWTNTIHNNVFYYGQASLDPLHLDTIYTSSLITEQSTLSDNDYFDWDNSNANFYWSPFVDVFGPTGAELDSSDGYPQYPFTFSGWQGYSNGGSPSVNEDVGSIQSDPTFLQPSHSWAQSNYFELSSSSPAFSSPISFTQPPIMQMGPQGSASPAVRINCSGSASWPFLADVDYSGGNWTGYGDTINTSAPNSAPGGIYDTQRYGTFTYTIPGFAVGSRHTVRLHFAELWYGVSGRGGTGTGPGSRLMNISINGTQVLSNFDVYSTAGGADIADVEQFSALANSSGDIVLSFAPSSGSPDPNAICNGIEIDPTPQTAIAQIDAGGGAVTPFVSDMDYSGGSTYSYSDTINTSAVNSAPASVYDSGREGSSFSYEMTGLKPGSPHIVRLHFAETYYGISGRGGTTTGVGSRFFNVSINGAQMLTNYDVYAAAGGPDIAVVDQLPAIADSNGDITISFASGSGSPDANAIVSGIELY